MAIVYQHRRKDTNEVFYIGIGSDEKRAYEYGRNHLWQEVVDETEYDIEITHKDIIWEEACAIEKYLISFWGRKDLGLGLLTNLTDGGDGTIGFIRSAESNKKQSDSMKRISHIYKTPEFRKKMSEVTSGESNPMYSKNHKQESINKIKECWTDEKRQYYKEINTGEKNPMFGKKNLFRSETNKKQTGENNPRAKAVLQYSIDGKFIKEYATIKEANKVIGSSKVGEVCRGLRPHTRGFIFKFKN